MMVMKTPCHACGKQGESRMCLTDIPYFKVIVDVWLDLQEVIIMSFVCDHCGFRTNEVGDDGYECKKQIKGGGSIPQQGQRTILRTDEKHIMEDLRRDILKSDTAAVYVFIHSINLIQSHSLTHSLNLIHSLTL